jgi:hypothetical protein
MNKQELKETQDITNDEINLWLGRIASPKLDFCLSWHNLERYVLPELYEELEHYKVTKVITTLKLKTYPLATRHISVQIDIPPRKVLLCGNSSDEEWGWSAKTSWAMAQAVACFIRWQTKQNKEI